MSSITVDRTRFEFASLDITIAGALRALGFQSISYSDTLTPTKVRGTSAQPIGRTRGEYDAEGSLTLLKKDADELRAVLGQGFMEKVFQITVAYAENAGDGVVVDRLIDCRIRGNSNDHSQGTDALTETLELDVMRIMWNGKNPLLNMRA